LSIKTRINQRLEQLWNSIGFRIGCGYFSVFIVTLAIISSLLFNLLNQLVEETINEYGNTVATQLAQSSVDDVIRGDIISLRAQLENLTKLDTIITAAIYDIDNKPIAQAGATPNSHKEIPARAIRNYPAPITFDNTLAGKAIVSLNTENLLQIQSRLYTSLSIGILISIILTIIISYIISRISGNFYNRLVEQLDESAIPIDGTSTQNWRALGSSIKNLKDYVKNLDPVESGENAENKVPARSRNQHSYAELLIECMNYDKVLEQVHYREFQSLTARFHSFLEHAQAIYHGRNIDFNGNFVLLQFSSSQMGDPSFQAICCARVLHGLIKNLNQNSTINIKLEFRMAIHWQQRNLEQISPLLYNKQLEIEREELISLCNQGRAGDIIIGKNIRQFDNVAEHVKLELISGDSDTDYYRILKISDNYHKLIERQISQLARPEDPEARGKAES
jgi:uncharacterized membrane protein affecting hemolysin expression